MKKNLDDDNGIHMNTIRIINQVGKLINNFNIYNDENKKIQLEQIKANLIDLDHQIIEEN